MLEKTLEAKFRHEVARLGGVAMKFVSAGAGVADRVVVLPGGQVVFVELKTDTGRLSRGQEVWLERMRTRGALVYVLRGEAGLSHFLEWARAGCPQDWQDLADKVLANSVATPSGCLEHQNTPTRYGYTRVKHHGREYHAHRVTLAAATGADLDDMPEGVFALHSCDNRRCVNPEHLRWGSAQDNTDDMISRGRKPEQQRTHCPRGHTLVGANLSPARLRWGHRQCLVCMRAMSVVRTAASYGRNLTLDDAIAAELARTDKGRDAVARDSRS